MWSWLTSLFRKSSNASNPATTANVASLPPLPIGSVAAVADALTQAGRVAEQQMAIRNTPQVQQAAIAVEQQKLEDKIKQDVANEDIEAMRRDVAD